MKSIVGLLEYTVTGAFVWIISAVFIAWVAVDAPGYREKSIADVWLLWATKLPSLPQQLVESTKPIHDVITLAIGGAFLVAIFVTGAVLDLLASAVFVVLEIRWAKAMLSRTHEWLKNLIKEEGQLVEADYHDLLRRRAAKDKPVEWELGKYRRVTAFLLGYVLATARPPQVEEVLDRLKLWRVSQAIGLALVLLIAAVTVWTLNTYDMTNVAEALKALVVAVLLPSAFLVVAYLLARLSFVRLAISLESALYIGFMRSRRPAPADVPAGAMVMPIQGQTAIAGLRSERQRETSEETSAAV